MARMSNYNRKKKAVKKLQFRYYSVLERICRNDLINTQNKRLQVINLEFFKLGFCAFWG